MTTTTKPQTYSVTVCTEGVIWETLTVVAETAQRAAELAVELRPDANIDSVRAL